MPWWGRSNAFCRRALLIGLAVATGCAHSQTDLQDRLSQRVTLPELSEARSSSKVAVKVAPRESKDASVQPAVALQPTERAQAPSQTDLKAALPPAIIPPPRRVDSDRAATSGVSLPSDSDEAALEAIAANGKPLSLDEAIRHAYRLQPRLRAQIEHISQARGAQQIAFAAFLPLVAANYDVGEFSLGVGGAPIHLSKGLPGFNFVPGVGAVPFGLNIGTSFELAELKVAWLLLDFGRRLGRYEQARLSTDIAELQTGRAYQTVANEVAVAYYNVLRSQALRRTTQEALRRADDELADARKRQREGVVEREIVLRAEVQRAETLQSDHAATGAQFTALAALNLAIGLKCNQPVRVLEPPEPTQPAITLADCLETAVRQRREFGVVRSTVEIAVQGTRVARADFAPKVIANGSMFDWQQQFNEGRVDFRLGFIRLEWVLFEGGRRIAANRVAEAQVRQAMAQAEAIVDQIGFQVNEAYREAVTAWVGIADARPAVDQARENYRLVQLRLREGAATPTEIADAQASLTRAEQNLLNARYNYLIAMDRLQYAMGVGEAPVTTAPAHH
jgi:outer membrane protein TolC